MHSEVYDSHTFENAVGIFIALQPHLPSKVSLYSQVHDNVVENNNLDGETNQNLPHGTGILVLAADHVSVQGNILREHDNAGLAVYSLAGDFAGNKMDVGVYPEYLSAQNNLYSGNHIDIFWDGTGTANAFDDQASSSPRILPSREWAEPIYRIYWRLLNMNWN